MNRTRWLLTALASILVVAVWYLLMWSPTSDDIEATESERDAVEAQAAELRVRATSLRQVRDQAPEAAATLATASNLLPTEAALPPLLRQMQQAADEAGARLTAVAPGRPQAVEEAPAGLSSIELNVSAQGTYFQLVDLLRRLEDPSITGRGIVWRQASLSISEREYPILVMSLSASVFSRMDAAAVADAPDNDEETSDDQEQGSDEDGEPSADDATPAPAEPMPADGAEGEIQ